MRDQLSGGWLPACERCWSRGLPIPSRKKSRIKGDTAQICLGGWEQKVLLWDLWVDQSDWNILKSKLFLSSFQKISPFLVRVEGQAVGTTIPISKAPIPLERSFLSYTPWSRVQGNGFILYILNIYIYIYIVYNIILYNMKSKTSDSSINMCFKTARHWMLQ